MELERFNPEPTLIELCRNAYSDVVAAGAHGLAAARRIVEARDRFGIDATVEACREVNKGFTKELVERLYDLGTGKIVYELYDMPQGPGVRKARTYAPDLQQRLLNEKVRVATIIGEEKGKLTIEFREVAVADLTTDDVRVALGKTGPNSDATQRSILQTEWLKKHSPTVDFDKPWRVVKRECIFMANARLTKRQVEEILKEMK